METQVIVTGTEMEQTATRVETVRFQRIENLTHIDYDFDAFQLAKGARFANDFELFKMFIKSYNGRDIDSYLQLKKASKNGNRPAYLTARFPQLHKADMMELLSGLVTIETKRINSKTTQYRITAVNEAAVEYEIAQANFRAKKFSA